MLILGQMTCSSRTQHWTTHTHQVRSDLLNVVVWEESFFTPQTTLPPARGIWDRGSKVIVDEDAKSTMSTASQSVIHVYKQTCTCTAAAIFYQLSSIIKAIRAKAPSPGNEPSLMISMTSPSLNVSSSVSVAS